MYGKYVASAAHLSGLCCRRTVSGVHQSTCRHRCVHASSHGLLTRVLLVWPGLLHVIFGSRALCSSVRAGVYVALKVGHPVEDEDDPDYQVHLTEWASYQRLGAVMNEVADIQQFGIAEGEASLRILNVTPPCALHSCYCACPLRTAVACQM